MWHELPRFYSSSCRALFQFHSTNRLCQGLRSSLSRHSTQLVLVSKTLGSRMPASSELQEQNIHTTTKRKMPSSETEPVLQFAKLSEHARAPTRGSASAAGYDLYSAHDYVVPSKGKELVKTDIQIAVPDGCYGRVAPRSGLAVKNFIDVGAGVVDQDYRGNVGVVMFNFSDEDFKVSRGDRIAQLICEKICYPELQELPSLNKTERGSNGYGSTGKN